MQHNWVTAHAVIEEALRITKEDRNEKAGNAEDNFSKIAKVWSGLLEDKLQPGVVISPADTARLMIGMKLCRDMHCPHRDNRVDTVGYTACLERVEPTDDPSADRACPATLHDPMPRDYPNASGWCLEHVGHGICRKHDPTENVYCGSEQCRDLLVSGMVELR